MTVKATADAIRAEIAREVTGQDDAVTLLLVALFAGGHVLVEGPPGTAKTLLARAFAAALGLDFGRIQFTPDLLPGDIVGANIYNFQTGAFTLTRGPVFCDILLADEINRTPPKTQAALLQAMQERVVTFDGVTHTLGTDFMVVATQNPIEHQGVYPLPEAQLDRFLFKHRIAYPDTAAEYAIVIAHGGAAGAGDGGTLTLTPQVTAGQLTALRAAVTAVTLAEPVVDYIVRLVRATREHPELDYGASPRAGAQLARAARAHAALDGRDYVVPDDVKALALPALRHRVRLSPSAQLDGREVEDLVADLIAMTEAPR